MHSNMESICQVKDSITSAQAFSTDSFSIVVAASLYNCKEESLPCPTLDSLVTKSCWIRRTSFKSLAIPLAIHALQTCEESFIIISAGVVTTQLTQNS